MPEDDIPHLFNALLSTTSSGNVTEVLAHYGDTPEMGLDTRFGPLDLTWHAFGDNASNISTIGLARDAGRSITERITNALDAILEDRFDPNVPPPTSPWNGARQWFGRPVSGPDEGSFRWRFADYGYDRRVAVLIHSSGLEHAPTIDVFDDGIGIRPEDFESTILSLQSGNKIRKAYLIGAFGQGGASTLAFCDYALIVSRAKKAPSTAGFTVIRVLRLDETYKEDTYGFLGVLRDGNLKIPTVELGTKPLFPYESAPAGIRAPYLEHGTIVRHYSYRIPRLQGSLGPAPGNLYHYLHYFLFDPILPFRLIDLRDATKARDELVSGSRNRLMRLVRESGGVDGIEERGSQIRHYRPMEYVAPYGTHEPCVGIEYWVVFNYRKGPAGREEPILRPDSNELYVQKGHPIAATLNGQTQGELTARILQQLGLGMVARHLVVHVDATAANKEVRRELFSTTREGFKEGRVLDSLLKILEQMLSEDKSLYEIEAELTKRLATHEISATRDEVKKQVARLLLEAGFRVKEMGKAVGPGEAKKVPMQPPRVGKHVAFDPLPTLPFPQVTKFRIVTPRPKLSVATNDIRVVLVETDADAEFDRKGLLALRCEPNSLEVAGKSPLRGGRIRWRLRPRQSASVGDTGKVVITLTKPDGIQLADSIDFEVLPPHEEEVKEEKGLVPPFEIIPIDPYTEPDKWINVWPDAYLDAPDPVLKSVAYKPVPMGGSIYVYYSTIFAPFKDAIERIQRESPAMTEMFRNNYEIWIGYHAILQQNERSATEVVLEESELEKLLEADRGRVARLQVKEAAQTAELTLRLLKEPKSE